MGLVQTPTEIAAFMKWGQKYSRHDPVNAKKFGAAHNQVVVDHLTNHQQEVATNKQWNWH